MLGKKKLAEWDVLRLDKPNLVRKRLERLLKTCRPKEVPSALLVYGATLRQLGNLQGARSAYYHGSKRAEKAGAELLVAAFVQRAAWVEAASDNYCEAFGFLHQSAGMFIDLGCRNSTGKVLVDLATLHLHQNNFGRSISCSAGAFSHLDVDEPTYFFAAHQNAALSHRALGNAKDALYHLEEAEILLGCLGKAFRVKFVWMASDFRTEIGSERGEALLVAADFFAELGDPLEAALATLEFSLLRFRQGDFGACVNAAKTVRRFAFAKDVEGNLLQKALMQVYRAALCGEREEERKKLGLLLRAAIKAARAAGAGAPTAPTPN